MSVAFSPSCYATEGVTGKINVSHYTAKTPDQMVEWFTTSTNFDTLSGLSDGSTVRDNAPFFNSTYNFFSFCYLPYGVNIPANCDYSISFNNLFLTFQILENGTVKKSVDVRASSVFSDSIRITYADGSQEIIYNPGCVGTSNNLLAVSYRGSSGAQGITQIAFCLTFDVNTIFKNYITENSTFLVEYGCADLGLEINYEASENEKGLLQSVVEWLQSIKDAIVNLPELIIEKIKGLFIPTEEDMTEIKDNFDLLMQERFGALYEAGSIISEFVDSFTFQGEKRSVAFPMVEIFLAEDLFVFGGWEVDLVPYGFESIIGVLKGLIGIVCTLLFVVMLRNKFNKIVGDNT